MKFRGNAQLIGERVGKESRLQRKETGLRCHNIRVGDNQRPCLFHHGLAQISEFIRRVADGAEKQEPVDSIIEIRILAQLAEAHRQLVLSHGKLRNHAPVGDFCVGQQRAFRSQPARHDLVKLKRHLQALEFLSCLRRCQAGPIGQHKGLFAGLLQGAYALSRAGHGVSSLVENAIGIKYEHIEFIRQLIQIAGKFRSVRKVGLRQTMANTLVKAEGLSSCKVRERIFAGGNNLGHGKLLYRRVSVFHRAAELKIQFIPVHRCRYDSLLPRPAVCLIHFLYRLAAGIFVTAFSVLIPK